jgi:hypothetical protein
MPRYLFHLSDDEHTFLDEEGKQLEDSRAAHEHALRIIDKARQFIPNSANSTFKLRITLPSGQSIMTVIAPPLGAPTTKPFGNKRAGGP